MTHAMKKHPCRALVLTVLLVKAGLTGPASAAAESEPPTSPEVTAVMQPYLDSYKLAGLVGIIADKNGKIHRKNLLGYADVEAKKPISEDNLFWIASMTKMFVGASIMMLVAVS
jgi:CubicO group peptidase (beta-lactamase class C family)